MIYIISFITSILLAHFAITERKHNPIVCYVLLFLSLIPPVMIAGARDISVGTDTYNYYGIFRRALSCHSFSEMLSMSDMEIGFQFYAYLCSRITSEPFIYFGFMQVLTLVPIYKSIIESNNSISFGLFIYYFLFYNMSLNISRQSIAVSFVLLAMVYLLKGNKKSYIIYSLLAVLFHKTAILSFLMYGIYYFCGKYDIKRQMYIYILTMVCFIAAVYIILTYTNILNYIIGQREVYSNYIKEVGESSVSKSSLIMYVIFSFLIYLPAKKTRNIASNYVFVLSILSTLMLFLSVISPPFGRLGIYFTICYVISIPYVLSNSIIRITYKKSIIAVIYKLFVIALIFIMWYFSIIMKGSHETYPYMSEIISTRII